MIVDNDQLIAEIFTGRVSESGNAIASVLLSVRLFSLYLRNQLTVDLGL